MGLLPSFRKMLDSIVSRRPTMSGASQEPRKRLTGPNTTLCLLLTSAAFALLAFISLAALRATQARNAELWDQLARADTERENVGRNLREKQAIADQMAEASKRERDSLEQERDKFNKERDAAKLGDEALGKERDELRRDKQRLEGELAAAKALADKAATLQTQLAAAQAKQAACSRSELHAIRAESKIKLAELQAKTLQQQLERAEKQLAAAQAAADASVQELQSSLQECRDAAAVTAADPKLANKGKGADLGDGLGDPFTAGLGDPFEGRTEEGMAGDKGGAAQGRRLRRAAA